MPEKDNNVLHNFENHKEEKYILKRQDIKDNQIDLIGKSLDTGSCIRDIPLERLLKMGYLKISLYYL